MKRIELYLSPSAGYRITDQNGKEYTATEARAADESGRVFNCNLAYARLRQFGYDVEATRSYYVEQNRKHAEARSKLEKHVGESAGYVSNDLPMD